METPSPAMKMPVWPVARKSAFSPRLRISFSSASAVYILPMEQSVPTVSMRLPLRFLPVPTAKSRVGWRTSNRLRPSLRARLRQRRHIHQPLVQAAGQIHAHLQRLLQHAGPVLADQAASVGNADDDCFHPCRLRLLQGHVRQLEVGLAAGHPQLADAPFRPPIGDALGGLGRQLIGRVAQEHEIGVSNGHQVTLGAVLFCRHPSDARR